jgi:hypothetical protein
MELVFLTALATDIDIVYLHTSFELPMREGTRKMAA